VLSWPSADSFAVGQRQKSIFQKHKSNYVFSGTIGPQRLLT
jgi:hypothetical protein